MSEQRPSKELLTSIRQMVDSYDSMCIDVIDKRNLGVKQWRALLELAERGLSHEPTEAPEIAARLDKADEFIAESRKEPSCSILSTDTEPSDVRSDARKLQAYPKLAEFFEKYALGSKLPPSCFVCGEVVIDIGVRHMELADVQCCKRCKDAADKARHAEPPDDRRDAQRWRALIGCARVRVLGSAGLQEQVGTTGYAHIGVEFWTHHEAASHAAAIERLTQFADRAAQTKEPTHD